MRKIADTREPGAVRIVVDDGEETGSEALAIHGHRVSVIAVFLVIATLYVITLFVPDPSLHWAARDEVCCHIPAIRAFQEQRLLETLQYYPSATTPLYHLLMALVFGRVDSDLLRIAWVVITLAVGFLLYLEVRSDVSLRRRERAAVALAIAFLLSPTIRASAVYFVTDGLAVHLAITALVLLRRARAGSAPSLPLNALAVILGYSSFYTRQYYLWATLYVAYNVFSNAASRCAKLATTAGCLLLTVPAVGLFALWHGLTPVQEPFHTQPALLSTVPNELGLLAVYSLPLVWIAARDGARVLRQRTGGRPLLVSLLVVGGVAFYVATGLALGFEIPRAGGILRTVNVFGWFGDVLFLGVSYVGLVMLLRWLVIDGLWQLWWAAFLLPLLAGEILLQRYFEPAIMVFMFLVARPGDALKVLQSRLVWFYPLFAAVYALSRVIYYE
jgi:hypothetical protein